MEQAFVVPFLYREFRTKGSESWGDLALNTEPILARLNTTFWTKAKSGEFCYVAFGPWASEVAGRAVTAGTIR
jgi:hypothetical protein